MIIRFLPPSNWKGANLVTHELHRRKKMQPGNETALCFSELLILHLLWGANRSTAVESRTHCSGKPTGGIFYHFLPWKWSSDTGIREGWT